MTKGAGGDAAALVRGALTRRSKLAMVVVCGGLLSVFAWGIGGRIGHGSSVPVSPSRETSSLSSIAKVEPIEFAQATEARAAATDVNTRREERDALRAEEANRKATRGTVSPLVAPPPRLSDRDALSSHDEERAARYSARSARAQVLNQRLERRIAELESEVAQSQGNPNRETLEALRQLRANREAREGYLREAPPQENARKVTAR